MVPRENGSRQELYFQVLKEVYTQMAKHISVSYSGCLLRNISLRHLCLDRDLSPMKITIGLLIFNFYLISFFTFCNIVKGQAN